MEMPVMDGYAAAKSIRHLGNSPVAPIIALTAHNDQAKHQECLDSGCSTVLTKPLRKHQLLQVIHEYLEIPEIKIADNSKVAGSVSYE